MVKSCPYGNLHIIFQILRDRVKFISHIEKCKLQRKVFQLEKNFNFLVLKKEKEEKII